MTIHTSVSSLMMYFVECNECGECHDLDAETFEAAVEEVKEAFWRIRKEQDGSWGHVCTGCIKALSEPPPTRDEEEERYRRYVSDKA